MGVSGRGEGTGAGGCGGCCPPSPLCSLAQSFPTTRERWTREDRIRTNMADFMSTHHGSNVFLPLTHQRESWIFAFHYFIITRRGIWLCATTLGQRERRDEPWWSRGDEREASIHEEVCGDPGFCSECPGLGEWSQQFASAGETFDSTLSAQ